eukprot:gnl/MRDRNA2_/MRDRNA2_116166_c0_seq1.p1 gnl/MRDRNA2_/MRDRNA2_116166_c0~~gnl/MRDRNA2_/MRDRNA2_116166_c0_seq1.p1  ORF type:complete len:554 (+),score=79.77 gnl/MRDRNA2_/MRDRNA2_116166_c0_seq1:101-1762(+)
MPLAKACSPNTPVRSFERQEVSDALSKQRGTQSSGLGSKAFKIREEVHKNSSPQQLNGTHEESTMDPTLAEAMCNFRDMLFEKGNGSFLKGWRTYFDDNGDERLSFGAFYRGLANMGYSKNPSVLWQALGQQNKAETETVSLYEVDPWSATVLKVFKDWVVSLGGPAKVFDAIDIDENHALTKDEFVRQVASLDLDLPQVPAGSPYLKPMDDVFQCLDKDGAGVISPDEFLFLESDLTKRRALERHLEQRRFEKLAGYNSGSKNRPWRTANFLRRLNQQTNPIFGGKHFSQLTDEDMSLSDSITSLLHRSSITKEDSIFNSSWRNLTGPQMSAGSLNLSGDPSNGKPLWMVRAICELERAGLASSEGHRADIREQVQQNLTAIQASDEKLKELADNYAMTQLSPTGSGHLTFGSRQGRFHKPQAKRTAPQPFIAPLDINCRKHLSSKQSSTRCSTADSGDLGLRSVSRQNQAQQKRRAAYSAPVTPELQLRKHKKNLVTEKQRMMGTVAWGHVYRPATSPDGIIHSPLMGISGSAPQIGERRVCSAEVPLRRI